MEGQQGSRRNEVWHWVRAGLAVLALIAGLIYFLLGRQPPKMQVVILSNTSLVQVADETLAGEIECFYEGLPADNLSVITVMVENSGREAIRPEDYEREMRLLFLEPATVLDATPLDSDPGNLKPEIDYNQDTVSIQPLLLNGGDKFTAQLLVINLPLELASTELFDVDSRIANITDIPKKDAIESGSTPYSVLDIVFALLLFLPPTTIVLSWLQLRLVRKEREARKAQAREELQAQLAQQMREAGKAQVQVDKLLAEVIALRTAQHNQVDEDE